jgi:hypothetical protein
MTTSSRVLALLLVGACSEEGPARSGVDPSSVVADLTSADVQLFCDWSVGEQGGVGHSEMCDDGSTVTTKSVANCVDTVADLTCTDTIGTLEDCIIATAGNLCLLETEPACAAYAACVPDV